MTRTAAAELVTILYDEGISHLFVNPGMHAAALREALAEADTLGVPHPQAVLCVHEQVALTAAHGHHLASGAPQAVMVHVETGRLSLGAAVQNVQRDRVPVVLFSGDRAECRQLISDRHDSPSHAGSGPVLLGASGKWAADLSMVGDPGTLLRRAFQIARAEPAGLTHVALPVELLGRRAGPPSRRLVPPRPPAPDLTALDEMAGLLATAEWPLIVAGHVGRHVAAVHELARLAEALGAPVIDSRNAVNLPPGHPLNAGLDAKELLDRADAILLLDVELPCVPGLGAVPSRAWLLQIDMDCLKPSLPGWASPVEIAVTADTQLALPPLLSMLVDRLSTRRRRVQDRRARVERTIRATHVAWRERAASDHPADRADAVLAELNRWLPEDAVIVEEAVPGAGNGTIRQLERPPGHLFRVMAADPGWALGAAMGARLARPLQPVIAICDDSAFRFGLPHAAFWSAHRAAAPFLTVVLDREGRSGSRPASDPDVASIARASGAETIVVEGPGEVAETLEHLLATTRDGVCTVMDVRLPATTSDDQARSRRRRNPLTSASTVTKRAPE
jgi:acetolactate synthase I/II/III large subunit